MDTTHLIKRRKQYEHYSLAKNAYTNARREYSERFGSYVQNAKNWRLIGLIALFVACLSLIGNWHLASQSKTIPYIVQVDRLGQPVFAGVPQFSSSNNPLIIRSILETWVRQARCVLADPNAQRHYIDFVYAFLLRNSSAFNELSEWYQKRQPFALGQKQTIDIINETAVPIGDGHANTWTVSWDEIITKEDGSTSPPIPWTANITFRRGAISLFDERSTLNPIGLQITHFSWIQKN